MAESTPSGPWRHLPVNDKRNNPKFIQHHPNYKFDLPAVLKGTASKPGSKPASHRHHPHSHHHHHHSGQHSPHGHHKFDTLINVKDEDIEILSDLTINGEDPDVNIEDSNSADFIFHEAMSESYDLDIDDIYNNGSNHEPPGIRDNSVSTARNIPNVFSPSNLAVSSITQEVTTSTDGSATYSAALSFAGFDGSTEEDYEVRIVKVQ